MSNIKIKGTNLTLGARCYVSNFIVEEDGDYYIISADGVTFEVKKSTIRIFDVVHEDDDEIKYIFTSPGDSISVAFTDEHSAVIRFKSIGGFGCFFRLNIELSTNLVELLKDISDGKFVE